MTYLLLLYLATGDLPHMEATPAIDRARLVVYASVAGLAFGHRAEELLALAWKESRMRQRPPRSSAGACGAFQALGGRYDHPRCSALEGDLWLATVWGAADLAYWKDHCGGRALAAYNGGWAGCRGKCSGGFAADVRRAERKLERAARRITGSGSGDGYGYGDGNGSGRGDGDGYGRGDGYGYGDGNWSGYGDGYGDGDGYGRGDGSGSGRG